MKESLAIVLPRKMSLTERISEASRQINEWLQSLDVVFNNERDKLQMTKWERNDREYRYHYLVIKGKASSVDKVSTQVSEPEVETSEISANHLRIIGLVTGLSYAL
ncbi:MAG: hypothetical protein JSW15_07080 [Deltaproteobacteria bacterium]|nr:MAG: hypothetical protein JSW15_07080 [Deltaproteobacteria bacterium]